MNGLIRAALVGIVCVWSVAAPQLATADDIRPLLAANGYEGRLKLARDLDDPRGYCLDVPGPASNILLHLPGWTHSCHSGPEPDQVYRFNLEGKGRFRFVHETYNLCLTADESAAKSRFNYQPCDREAGQSFRATPEGRLVLQGTDLCLAAMNMAPGGSQDEVGKGRDVQATHKIRILTLRPCGTGAPELERWVALQP